VLLHDGGGDRSATVAALPRNYRLLPATRIPIRDSGPAHREDTGAEFMPPPGSSELGWAHIEGEAFDAKSTARRPPASCFCGHLSHALRSMVYGALAVIQKVQARHRRFDPAWRPPVTVLIAAFNEEKVIRKTVESILGNGYEDLEAIVVDDGSRDRTLAVLEEAFGNEPRVRILSQANAGKSAALNRASGRPARDPGGAGRRHRFPARSHRETGAPLRRSSRGRGLG